MPAPRAAAEVIVSRRAESGVRARGVSSGFEAEELATEPERGVKGAAEREARRRVAARARGVVKCMGDIEDLLKGF